MEAYLESVEIDFDDDGRPEVRLVTSLGGVTAFVNHPVRVVERTNVVTGSNPPRVDYGGIFPVPFGSTIGNTLSPELTAQRLTWWAGFTNSYDLTVEFGNHQADFVSPIAGGPSWNQEAVMGVEFPLGGEVHYGYVHFDLRMARSGNWEPGLGGYIYGWAYEDAPGAPITAVRIRDEPPVREFRVTDAVSLQPFEGNGAMALAWNAVVGKSYRVQATDGVGAWNDVSDDLTATSDRMSFTTLPNPASQRFFRVVQR